MISPDDFQCMSRDCVMHGQCLQWYPFLSYRAPYTSTVPVQHLLIQRFATETVTCTIDCPVHRHMTDRHICMLAAAIFLTMLSDLSFAWNIKCPLSRPHSPLPLCSYRLQNCSHLSFLNALALNLALSFGGLITISDSLGHRPTPLAI